MPPLVRDRAANACRGIATAWQPPEVPRQRPAPEAHQALSLEVSPPLLVVADPRCWHDPRDRHAALGDEHLLSGRPIMHCVVTERRAAW